MPPKKRTRAAAAAADVADKSPPPKRQTRAKKAKAADDAEPDEAVQSPNAITIDSSQPVKKQPKPRKGKATKAQPQAIDDADDDEDAKIQNAFPQIPDNHQAAEANVIPKTSKDILVPLDEGVPLYSHKVYIDPDDGVIHDVTLNQTNASGNNNKFYRIQVSRFRSMYAGLFG